MNRAIIMTAEEIRPGDYLGTHVARVTSARIVGDTVVIGATLLRDTARAGAGTPLVRVVPVGSRISALPHYL